MHNLRRKWLLPLSALSKRADLLMGDLRPEDLRGLKNFAEDYPESRASISPYFLKYSFAARLLHRR